MKHRKSSYLIIGILLILIGLIISNFLLAGIKFSPFADKKAVYFPSIEAYYDTCSIGLNNHYLYIKSDTLLGHVNNLGGYPRDSFYTRGAIKDSIEFKHNHIYIVDSLGEYMNIQEAFIDAESKLDSFPVIYIYNSLPKESLIIDGQFKSLQVIGKQEYQTVTNTVFHDVSDTATSYILKNMYLGDFIIDSVASSVAIDNCFIDSFFVVNEGYEIYVWANSSMFNDVRNIYYAKGTTFNNCTYYNSFDWDAFTKTDAADALILGMSYYPSCYDQEYYYYYEDRGYRHYISTTAFTNRFWVLANMYGDSAWFNQALDLRLPSRLYVSGPSRFDTVAHFQDSTHFGDATDYVSIMEGVLLASKYIEATDSMRTQDISSNTLATDTATIDSAYIRSLLCDVLGVRHITADTLTIGDVDFKYHSSNRIQFDGYLYGDGSEGINYTNNYLRLSAGAGGIIRFDFPSSDWTLATAYFRTLTDSQANLGAASLRFINIYSYDGDYAGDLTVDGYGEIQNHILKLVATDSILPTGASAWYTAPMDSLICNTPDSATYSVEGDSMIIISKSGAYFVNYGLAFTAMGVVNNADVGGRVTVNGTEKVCLDGEEHGDFIDGGSATINNTCIVEITAPDTLKLQYYVSDVNMQLKDGGIHDESFAVNLTIRYSGKW